LVILSSLAGLRSEASILKSKLSERFYFRRHPNFLHHLPFTKSTCCLRSATVYSQSELTNTCMHLHRQFKTDIQAEVVSSSRGRRTYRSPKSRSTTIKVSLLLIITMIDSRNVRSVDSVSSTVNRS
jgi:hypothetical protein